MECLILRKEEIDEEECACITREAYLPKNTKDLPNKIKRIVGWQGICKGCKYHKPEKKKARRYAVHGQ